MTPPAAGMEAFNISLTGLGANVQAVITSMSPLLLLAAGLIIGTGVLAYGTNLVKSFRGGK